MMMSELMLCGSSEICGSLGLVMLGVYQFLFLSIWRHGFITPFTCSSVVGWGIVVGELGLCFGGGRFE